MFKMFLLNFGFILLMLTFIKADIWKNPTAVDIQTSLETCQMTDLLFLDIRRNKETYNSTGNSNIRCFTKELGLWSDDEGFMPARFMQLLSKHKQPEEIRVVISYCNDRHKQTDLDKWANDGFYCFARGSMGPWINEYVKNVYKKKLSKK